MSDTPINQMDFKQLRNEVQLLRDELAIMKRQHEDMLYNLDTENFSQRIVKQGKNLYTKIEQTADEIVLQAEKIDSATDSISSLQVQADGISAEVSKVKEGVTKNKTLIEQTANDITLAVTAEREYVTNLLDSDYYTSEKVDSQIELSANGIKSIVSTTYQTKDEANASYGSLRTEIWQTSDSIESIVSKNISAYFERDFMPTANNTTAKEQSMLCYYNDTYWYFNDIANEWLEYPAEGLKTMFKQTEDGFEMTGNVTVTEVARVANGLYIGNETDTTEKQLVFSDYARMTAYNPGIGVNSGLYISASELKLGARIVFSENAAVDFENADVTGLRITFG